MYDNVHLSGGDTSAFVILSATIARSDHTALMAVLCCAEIHPCGRHGSLELDTLFIT